MRQRLVLAMALGFVACSGPGGRQPNPGTGGDDAGMMNQGGDDMPGPRLCEPKDPPSCEDGTTVRVCRTDGSGYNYTPCPPGATCLAGACTCVAGSTICQAQNVMKCGMDGSYHLDHTCSGGTQCNNGVCGDLQCDEEKVSTNPHALPVLGWPRFRHDNRNSGVSPATVAMNPQMKWKVRIGGTTLNGMDGLASGPVVNQDNVLFIGAGDQDMKQGSYYSLDAKGTFLFTFPASRGYGLSTPAVRNDGTSYFSTTTSKLYAIDPKGMQQWQYGVGSQADSDPIITKDGTLIYSSDDGSVYALDPVKGTVIWKTMAGGPGEVDGGMAETCDGKVIVGGMNGWFALDVKTGSAIWQVKATGGRGALLSSPVVTGEGNVYGFDSGGTGWAIDPKGNVLWKKLFTGEGPGASTAFLNGVLYTVLYDHKLHAVDATNGNEKWARDVNDHTGTYLLAGPIVDGAQHILFNSSDGFVYAFDAAGNQLWKIAHSGKSTTPTWSGTMAIGKDGTLYVPGNDGWLYAFQ